MKTATQKTKEAPKTLDLRDRLKVMIDRELNGLPDLLEGLDSRQRLDVILKLIPLVLPRSKPVHYSANEQMEWP